MQRPFLFDQKGLVKYPYHKLKTGGDSFVGKELLIVLFLVIHLVYNECSYFQLLFVNG
jgi:hypothetical protein